MQVIMKTQIGYKSMSTTINIEEFRILTSRLIDSRLITLDVEVDGTIGNMIEKCERVSRLTNDMYKMLADVQVSN
jgi:hypothetical protein